jgi:hypothetical protein
VSLRIGLLDAVAAAPCGWRDEISLCCQFGGAENHEPTEDQLFELVQQGLLEWFGPDEKALRYRVTELGKKELERANVV